MSITQTNTIAKIAAVVAGLGLVAMSFASFAVPAKADTNSDLQAQISSLLAQIAALQAQLGGGTGACTSFMANLTVGSRGADVTALQKWLIAQGDGMAISAGATGYFGSQTKAALASYQAHVGITPAVGYFGPITRAKVNSLGCTTGAGGGSTGGVTTTGHSGYLSNLSTLGDVVSDVREGDVSDKLIGFSSIAHGSDISVQRLDVTFDMSASTGSTNLNRYLSSVSVYLDGKKLASMNPADGDYSSSNKTWTLRFSNLNGVIKEGNTGNLYVEGDAVSSVNANESGKTVKVSFTTTSLRGVDGQGVSEDYGVANTQSFTVSTANVGKLSLTEASDDPAATTVKADVNNTTTGVTLLAFNAKATNQDVKVRAIPVGFTGTTAYPSDAIQSVSLMRGGTTLSTKTFASSTAYGQAITFDNLNETISKDSTTEYTVVATIKKIDGTNSFSSSDYLVASTTNVMSGWDAQDAQGNTATLTGTVNGNNQTFQATGITVTKVSANTSTTAGSNPGEGDKTQYSISFKVTAGDSDLYIARAITRATTTPAVPVKDNVMWATTTSSGSAGVIAPGYTATNLAVSDTNSADTTNSFKVPAGASRTFTLGVTLTASSTGFTGVQLDGIGYGTVVDTFTNVFTSGLDTFKTSDVSMTTH